MDIEKLTQKQTERKALGRGLAAFFNQDNPVQDSSVSQTIASPVSSVKETSLNPISISKEEIKANALVELSLIDANPDQPRKEFDDEKIKELSESIKELGIIQPLVVVKNGERYKIIAGERRYRASKLAGLTKVPVFVRPETISTTENDLASLVENIQRQDLSPLELANAYQRILATMQFTQDTLAKKLGISRASVANTLRLLKLPTAIQEKLKAGLLTEGHAKALLAIDDLSQMEKIASEAIETQMSVRDLETRVRTAVHNKEEAIIKTTSAQAFSTQPNLESNNPFAEIEAELRQLFGTKISIRGNESKGTIDLYYTGKDSLNRLLHLLRSVKV